MCHLGQRLSVFQLNSLHEIRVGSYICLTSLYDRFKKQTLIDQHNYLSNKEIRNCQPDFNEMNFYSC